MSITPLITAAEAFPAFERLAAGARQELCLSFRIFDPRTRIRSPELREAGLETWKDLLRAVTARGVTLRLLIADFDPLFAGELHRNSWRCASECADALDGSVEILCAPHAQVAGPFWHLVGRQMIRDRIDQLKQEDPQRLTPPQRTALAQGPRLRPVTLHQKFAIADRQACIIGGLDIDERRFDDPEHKRAANETWHDVSMAVGGHFAQVLHSHFADCWNAVIASGIDALSDSLSKIDTSTRPQNLPDTSLLRTVSKPRSGFAALAPARHATEHETAWLREIAQSQDRVYIETQFLRHMPLVRHLAQQASAAPDLQLIVLVPTEPENVLFDGDKGTGARHAQALQMQALALLQSAYGDRLAVVSPAQPWAAPKGAPGTMDGSAPVYLHSKVAIFDDRAAIVGSANLNGRSLCWDTEASVLFRDHEAIQSLWTRLSEKWLGSDVGPENANKAATWRQAALDNAACPADERDAYLMPFPITRNKRFARWNPFIPDELF